MTRVRGRELLGIGVCLALFTGRSVAAEPRTQWAPDRLVVQPKAGVPEAALARVFARHRARIVDRVPEINVYVLGVAPRRLRAVERALSRTPYFKSVGRDHLRYLQATTPNDYWYPGQWHLPKIGAPQAWDFTVGNPNVVIAIIDGGAAAVPDLTPKLLPGINIIEGGTDTTGDEGHGTAVSGIAAAATNNSIGVAGVAWLSNILPVRVYSAGATTCSAITSGIVWAADHGARVINMSFGGPSQCSGEKSAIDYAWGKGAVLVAAAGNEGSSTPDYPAAYSNVMAVASTEPDDSHTPSSNYGSWLSVAAPGANLWTTYRNGGYSGFSGTSAATPVVSGVAALVLSANPALTNAQVQSTIEQNADDLGAPGFDVYYGWGRVNAYRAVLAAIGTAPPPPDITPPSASIDSPAAGATVSGTTTVNVTAADDVGVARVELYIDGALFATDTTPPFSFAWNTAQSGNGPHTLQAQAHDGAGNTGASGVVTVSVSNAGSDTTAPTVTIISPLNGSVVSKMAQVSVSARDDTQMQQIQVYVDTTRIGSASCSAASCTASIKWNTNKVAKGAHQLSALGYDTAGNMGASAPVTVYR